MSTKIRLQRQGCKKKPFYYIVVQDSRIKPRGPFKEKLGYFDPMSNKIKLNIEALTDWLSKGAIASETVKSLAKKFENANAQA